MDLMDKLTILADSAKYDAACTSSGADRPGFALPMGCCHSFSADGRCISLLKVLMSNDCVFDCKYCVNRASNDWPRASFTPQELAQLTLGFYRRNYIEGLFLSSGVVKTPDHTMQQMISALRLLRGPYGFQGYIHAKTIPGASPDLVRELGLLADRLSVNIELPSEESLRRLCPNKRKEAILAPMRQIAEEGASESSALSLRRGAPQFAPAGQSTQLIIGASPESDYRIISLASAMYKKYGLRRVFYSAYIPAVADSLLPSVDTKPPLLREHRLYQADFLMRQYGFEAGEILSEELPNLNPYLDPKCNWAVNHLDRFPVDVNRAPLETLLRVPGIGPGGARKIVTARRQGKVDTGQLRRMGIVLKRAQYFIVASDFRPALRPDRQGTVRALIDPGVHQFGMEQLSMFHDFGLLPGGGDVRSLTEAVEEAVRCTAAGL